MKKHSVALGARLRIARGGMSQGELAEEIGCNTSQVSRWEHGHYAPNLEHLTSIALATGASMDRLILGEGPIMRSAKRGGNISTFALGGVAKVGGK